MKRRFFFLIILALSLFNGSAQVLSSRVFFCEDIGAEPLPVLAAGVPFQNSSNNIRGIGGQQGGIPMADMPAYIQELLDLIEWANGDPSTSKWARMRADAGHPAPFNLKYIGIGNEDIISTVFEERYAMICKAIREHYPEIRICGTAGPFHSPSADYMEGWDFVSKHPDLQYMVDEHYYESVVINMLPRHLLVSLTVSNIVWEPVSFAIRKQDDVT